MSCNTLALRTEGLYGADPGGTWGKLGYGLTIGDTPTHPFPGGVDPPLTGDDPVVDFTGFVPGFYHFYYEFSDDIERCDEPDAVLTIQILPKGIAGTGATIDVCTGYSQMFELFEYITGGDGNGTWSLGEGSDVPDPLSVNWGDGFFIPGDNPAGVYIFVYTVPPPVPQSGYQLSCDDCGDVAMVTVIITDPCTAGEGKTVAVTDTTGAFNLFAHLTGMPDTGGTWTQLSGTPVTISNGYLGTVNLNGVAGCDFEFEYQCPGPDRCSETAIIHVIKNPSYNVTVSQTGSTLTATATGCNGVMTYQWQRWSGSAWVDITGAITNVLNPPSNNTLYRVRAWCSGCEDTAEQFYELTCDNVGNLGLSIARDGDCIEVTPTGSTSSPIATDTIQWRRVGATSWNPYPSICGCDFRSFLDVNPTCAAAGNSITLGWNSPQKCSGHTIDRVYVRRGDGTQSTHAGTYTSFTETFNASTLVNDYNREVTFIVRINIGGGLYLFQHIEFHYTGGTSAPTCGQVTITKVNVPEYLYPIQVRRVVTFIDGCPPVTVLDTWTPDNCPAVTVLLSKVNLGSTPSVLATPYNCLCGGSITYTWFKDGVLLTGETGNSVSRVTYGEGKYDVHITCCGCSAFDSLVTEGCTLNVVVSGPVSGTYTATASGCGGNKTYTWQRWTGSAWVTVKTTGPTGSNTDTYTPSQSGQYRVTVACTSPACDKEAQFTVELPCTLTVSIAEAGGALTATSVGCSGSRTWTWQRWTGSAWVTVQTATNSSNSNSYTPTQSGLYRVNINCASTGCVASAQYTFTLDCTFTVGLTGPTPHPTSPELYKVLTVTFTGCSGTKSYTFQKQVGGVWTTITSGSTGASSITIDIPIDGCGDYRVLATCVADGCTALDTINIECDECDASVTIVPSGNIFNAFVTGCTGGVSYAWYKRNPPGSGGWGAVIATTASVNVSVHGEGEYRVVINCGGCTAEDTEIHEVLCNYNVTANCGSNPLVFNVTGCLNTIHYQVQYSSTGSGWMTILATTSTPGGASVNIVVPITHGNGYYRLITWCGTYGNCPKSTDCHVTGQCDVTASISGESCLDLTPQDYLFLIDISGSIDGAEWTAMKASIDATIDGIVAAGVDAKFAVIQASGYLIPPDDVIHQSVVPFTSNPATAKAFSRQPASMFYFNDALVRVAALFPSTLTWRSGADQHLVLFTDAPRHTKWSSTLVKSNVTTGEPQTPYFEEVNTWRSDTHITVVKYPTGGGVDMDTLAVKAAAAIASVGGSYTGEVEANPGDIDGSQTTPRRLFINNFGDPVDGLINLTAGVCTTLTLTFTGCDAPAVAWQKLINGVWTTIQSGGLSYSALANGQYRARVTCSGCPAVNSNVITV